MSAGEREQRIIAEQQRRRRIQQELDLRAVLGAPEGRRFVWRVIEELCGAFSPSFTPGEPETTAFKEGKRHVGLKLVLEGQGAAPSEYVHMMGEALRSRNEEERERRGAAASDAETD